MGYKTCQQSKHDSEKGIERISVPLFNYMTNAKRRKKDYDQIIFSLYYIALHSIWFEELARRRCTSNDDVFLISTSPLFQCHCHFLSHHQFSQENSPIRRNLTKPFNLSVNLIVMVAFTPLHIHSPTILSTTEFLDVYSILVQHFSSPPTMDFKI